MTLRPHIRSRLVAIGALTMAEPAHASDFSPIFYIALGLYLLCMIPLCLLLLAKLRSTSGRAVAAVFTAFALMPLLHGPYVYSPVGLYTLFGISIDSSVWEYFSWIDAIVFTLLSLTLYSLLKRRHRRTAMQWEGAQS